jgi:hypothetical protein
MHAFAAASVQSSMQHLRFLQNQGCNIMCIPAACMPVGDSGAQRMLNPPPPGSKVLIQASSKE